MATKILIVEDEPLISADLELILSKEGYNIVGKAYNGVDALDMLHTRQPQIVLLDIVLSHAMSGLDVAQIINEKYKIPFIFITSFSDKDTLNKAKNLYPAGYIVKPFKKKDIIATVEILNFKVENETKSPYKTMEEINQSLFDRITPKEYEILIDVVEGLSNEKISEKHFVSINTVKTHLKRVFTKLDINSRTQVSLKMRKT